MALANFSDLKTAVARWLARGDLAGEAEDFIMLGEAALNRELSAVETDATLTGTIGSNVIDISALSVETPRSLFLNSGWGERQLTRKTDGTFPYSETNGEPSYWSVDGTNIKFDRPLDQAYSCRFEFAQRFALSDASPTNWLLTNHPDVYLAAVLVWGGVFTRNPDMEARYGRILALGISAARHAIAQKKRAELTVDAAITRVNPRQPYYDGSA